MKFIGGVIVNEVIPYFLGHSYNDINEWLEGKKSLREGKEHTALWRIMLDASTVQKNNLQFDCRLTLGEDTKFINSYLLKEQSLGVLERTLYYLTIREGSANITSNGNPELMTHNKLKLIDARKEIDLAAKAKGYDVHKYWEGTMVLSAVQLAIRLSHDSQKSRKKSKKIYMDYVNNSDVSQAIHQYKPSIRIKSIPFLMLKLNMENILFSICGIIPNAIVKKFI